MAWTRPLVRLLVFSGRPDPEWELNESTAAELRQRILSCPLAEVPKDFWRSQLGYRGFLVMSLFPAEDSGMVRVFGGMVALGVEGSAEYRIDDEGVEDWLLGQARLRGLSEVLKAMGAPGKGDPGADLLE